MAGFLYGDSKMKHLIWKDNKKLIAVTSTRLDGVSTGVFASLNLALHVGDKEEDVFENRNRLESDLKIAPQSIIYTYQSHSDIVKKVTKDDLGKGALSFEDGIPADALYTNEKNVPIAVFHADCVPVFIHVPKRHLVMIIHAGLEGSLKEITLKSIKHLIEAENIKAKDIVAHLGPSRSFSNYPTTIETIKKIHELGYVLSAKRSNNEYFVDVPLLNHEQLIKAGVLAKSITRSDACTYDDATLFYSAKRDQTCGRMISLIMIRD